MTNVMPPLSEPEYNALKASVEKNGVLVPIEIDEETGELLDGHHRQKICSELGIEAPKTFRRFSDDTERTEHALTLNLMRRQLGPISWAQSFEKLLETRGIKRERGGDRKSKESKSQSDTLIADAAKEVGVSRATAFRRLKLKDDLKGEPDLALNVDKSQMDAKDALRQKREREQLRQVKEQEPITQEEAAALQCDLRICAIKDMDIADESVDAIITDPPYPKKYLNLFGDLAYEASRVLKPGGVLVCMSGQAWLPEVYERLSEHLRYHWTSCYYMPGANGGVVGRNVSSNAWKPLLVYTKGPSDIAVGCDVIKSDAPDSETKELNRRWGQSESGIQRIVERFSTPRQLVWDPFMGNGTAAVACVATGRRFIGNDIDEQAVETTRVRIARLVEREAS